MLNRPKKKDDVTMPCVSTTIYSLLLLAVVMMVMECAKQHILILVIFYKMKLK